MNDNNVTAPTHGPPGPWAYTVVVRDREALLVTTVQRIVAGRYYEPVGYAFTVRDWCCAALQCVSGWSSPLTARFMAFMIKYFSPSVLHVEPAFQLMWETYQRQEETEAAITRTTNQRTNKRTSDDNHERSPMSRRRIG